LFDVACFLMLVILTMDAFTDYNMKDLI